MSQNENMKMEEKDEEELKDEILSHLYWDWADEEVQLSENIL